MPRSYGATPWNKREKDGYPNLFRLAVWGSRADGAPPIYNVAYRFGAQQDIKLRARDALKHSLGHRFRRSRTPAHLATWCHIAQISRLITKDGGEWHLFKADHEAAYKQLAIAPSGHWAAIVALLHPTSGKWFGRVTRAIVSGPVADVMRYNILSRFWTSPVCHMLGIPRVGYFVDFEALIRAGLEDEDLRVLPRFFAMLGFAPKPGKSSVRNAIVFSGLLGNFRRLPTINSGRYP